VAEVEIDGPPDAVAESEAARLGLS